MEKCCFVKEENLLCLEKKGKPWYDGENIKENGETVC